MKPSDDDKAMPMATGMGLNPDDTAVPMAMGAMRLVAAVCEVSSESSKATTQNTVTKSHSEGFPPKASLMPVPIHAESPVVYISPIFAIKMEDVKDKYTEITSRNINFDAVGVGMVNGTEYKAIGNGNNKYSSNYLCSDGSRVFIYDLTKVQCSGGALLPADQAVQFRVFQLKYADMRTIDHQITYNIYWVQTFKSMDELKSYLTEVDKVTWEE